MAQAADDVARACPALPEPATQATPLAAALAREEQEVASRALEALSESDREIVVMFYRSEDGSLRSVATALGISEATARQRLHRSRARLRAAVTAVEATLRATRPGAAFTAACVAALAAGVTPAEVEAAPFVPASTSALPLLLGAATLAMVGVGIAVVAAAAKAPTPASSAPAAAATTPARPAPETLGRVSARERAARLARIRQLQSARATPVVEKTYDFAGSRLDEIDTSAPPPSGPLGKSTLRYAIKAAQPLLLECLEDPDAHGTLNVQLQLLGEPANATIVERVRVDGEAPLAEDAALVGCVTGVLEALELPPMTTAERWIVHYPFVL